MYARNARIYEKYTFCIHEKDPFLNILLYLLNRPLFTSQSSTFFGKMHSSCIARHWLLGGFISWNRLVLIVGLTYLQRNNVYQNCSFMNLNLVYEFQPRLGLLHSFMNWLLHSFMNFTAFLYEFHCIPLWISLHSFMNFTAFLHEFHCIPLWISLYSCMNFTAFLYEFHCIPLWISLHSFMNFTAFLYEFHCIPLWISLHSFMNFIAFLYEFHCIPLWISTSTGTALSLI